jgi:hypothetical protein
MDDNYYSIENFDESGDAQLQWGRKPDVAELVRRRCVAIRFVEVTISATRL